MKLATETTEGHRKKYCLDTEIEKGVLCRCVTVGSVVDTVRG